MTAFYVCVSVCLCVCGGEYLGLELWVEALV